MRKILLVLIFFIFNLFAVDLDYAPKLSKQQAKKYLKQSFGYLNKDMKMKIKGLSKETKKLLIDIYRHHDRHSQIATLRQVMQEVNTDYTTMVSAIMMDNSEMAADAARRLANHRIPRGGLVAYLKIEDVNDEMLSNLDGMNNAVEGNAIKFAKAADKKDMLEAARLLTPIANGCISCHNIFRGKPGMSPYVKY